jgi:hypothetical protein
MTESQLRALYDRTIGHCHFCGDPVVFDRRGWASALEGYWEVDHLIQRHKGGPRAADNCLAACTRCNRLRWHRTGEAVRELLLLGLLARAEIARGSETGLRLLTLRETRLAQNELRRLVRAARRSNNKMQRASHG